MVLIVRDYFFKRNKIYFVWLFLHSGQSLFVSLLTELLMGMASEIATIMSSLRDWQLLKTFDIII